MTPWEDLSNFIEPDYNPDYWSDDAVLHANKLVLKLQAADWEDLSKSWEGRNSGWKRRLADALDVAPPELGFPLVSRMLLSPDDAVAKAAAGTIKDYVGQGYPGTLSKAAVDRLKELSKSSPLYKMVFADIIERFEKLNHGH